MPSSCLFFARNIANTSKMRHQAEKNVELARGQKIEQLLLSQAASRDPDAAPIRLVLFYGPDAGQISENGKNLLRQLGVKTDNDFQLSRLTGADLAENPKRFALDVNSQCLTGERRVVWLTSAGEGNKGGSQILAWLKTLASDAAAAKKNAAPPSPRGPNSLDSLVIAELGELPTRSPLRTAVKSSPFAVAVACYADSERDLAGLIKSQLARERITVSDDALQAMVANMGADRLATRAEIEKFALYAGPGGRIDLADVVLLIGDAAALSLDALLLEAAQGHMDRLDRNWQRAVAAGENGVALIRAALRYFQRLELIVARVAGGMPPRQAVAAQRPPIFWRDVDPMVAQAGYWTMRAIRQILAGLIEAERQCKSNDYADLVVAGWHYNRIAAAGLNLRQRSQRSH